MDDLERAARAAEINEKRHKLEPGCEAGDAEAIDQWFDLTQDYAVLFDLDVPPPPSEAVIKVEVPLEKLIQLQRLWRQIERLGGIPGTVAE